MTLSFLVKLLAALAVLAYIWQRTRSANRAVENTDDLRAPHRSVADEAVTAVEDVAGELLGTRVAKPHDGYPRQSVTNGNARSS